MPWLACVGLVGLPAELRRRQLLMVTVRTRRLPVLAVKCGAGHLSYAHVSPQQA